MKLPVTFGHVAFGLALILGASGCNPPPRTVVTLDDRVKGHLFEKYEQVDAEKFFKSGGRYWNMGDEDEPQVDRKVVLPLIQRARQELQIPFTVLFDAKDPKYGIMLLGKVPSSESKRESFKRMIVEAEDEFKGIILDEWSEEWLALDFLGPEQVASLGLLNVKDKLR